MRTSAPACLKRDFAFIMRNPSIVGQEMSFENSTSRYKHDSTDLAPPVSTDEKGPVDPVYTGAETSGVDPKRILLKMDVHLIPMLALLYLLSFLDRGNIGNARIEGLVETLNMTGPQYNWCCTVLNGTHDQAPSH